MRARAVLVALLIEIAAPWLLLTSYAAVVLIFGKNGDPAEPIFAAGAWLGALALLHLAYVYLRGDELGRRSLWPSWLLAAASPFLPGAWESRLAVIGVIPALPLLFLLLSAWARPSTAGTAQSDATLPLWTIGPVLLVLSASVVQMTFWPELVVRPYEVGPQHAEAMRDVRLIQTLVWSGIGIALLARRGGQIGKAGLLAGVVASAFALWLPSLGWILSGYVLRSTPAYFAITVLCCATIRKPADAWIGAILCLVTQVLVDVLLLMSLSEASLFEVH